MIAEITLELGERRLRGSLVRQAGLVRAGQDGAGQEASGAAESSRCGDVKFSPLLRLLRISSFTNLDGGWGRYPQGHQGRLFHFCPATVRHGGPDPARGLHTLDTLREGVPLEGGLSIIDTKEGSGSAGGRGASKEQPFVLQGCLTAGPPPRHSSDRGSRGGDPGQPMRQCLSHRGSSDIRHLTTLQKGWLGLFPLKGSPPAGVASTELWSPSILLPGCLLCSPLPRAHLPGVEAASCEALCSLLPQKDTWGQSFNTAAIQPSARLPLAPGTEPLSEGSRMLCDNSESSPQIRPQVILLTRSHCWSSQTRLQIAPGREELARSHWQDS